LGGRFLSIFFFTACIGFAAEDQPKVTLELVCDSHEFELGDQIKLSLRFSSNSKNATVRIFQPGPVRELSFKCESPEDKEPRDLRGDGWGGSGRDRVGKPVEGKPFDFPILLNEYLIFDEPGIYEVKGTFSGNIHVVSGPVKLTIRERSLKTSDARLAAAEKLFGSGKPIDAETAAIDLGCMHHERSIPLLLRNLRYNRAFRALATFKNLDSVKHELHALLENSEFAIRESDVPAFLSLSSVVDSHGSNWNYDDHKKWENATLEKIKARVKK
jgi:hypothetical protein